jgi:hypothetical protein
LIAFCLALLAAITSAIALPAMGAADGPEGLGGTVTAEGGGALEDVDVCAYAVGDPSTSVGCELTDSNGAYEIAALPAGEYTVEFTPPAPGEYFTQWYSGATSAGLATPVQVTAAMVTPGIDAALVKKPPPGPGEIGGKVSAQDTGLSMPGAQVCAEKVGGSGPACDVADGSGEYEITGLAEGQYTVEFTPPGGAEYFGQWYSGATSVDQATPVAVTAETLTPGIDATLVKKPPSGPGRISGKVTASDTSLAVADVTVCAEPFGGGGSTCEITAASGEYEIGGLNAGQYTVEFTPPNPAEYFGQWYSGATSVGQATQVEVKPATLTPGVDATLVKTPPSGPGSITGKVTAAGTGSPIAGVVVCAELTGAAGRQCETTPASGEYEITGLVEGQYTVEFSPPAEYLAQWYSGATAADQAMAVGVSAGTVTPGIDAVLQKHPSGPGKIVGKVTAADTGQPIEGVKVCVEEVGVSGSTCETTDGSGDYTLSHLPAGQWLIRYKAQGAAQNLLSLSYPNKEIWETPAPVTVSPGGEKTINVTLKTGGQITGTVRLAATGVPVAGVRVCLTEAEVFASLACLTTPSSGIYRFTAVWPGHFKVVFSAAAGEFPDATPITDAYTTQWWNGQPTYGTAAPIAVVSKGTVSPVDASLTPIAGAGSGTTMSDPSASTPAPPPVAVAAARASSKLPKCRTGYARRKVKGKVRCVKRQKHHKKTAHGKHKKSP